MGEASTQDILFRLQANDGLLARELTLLCERLASKMSLPPYALPADIAQDVLLAVITALRAGTFRGECDIRTFVYRIAVNTCVARGRELKRRQLAGEDLELIADSAPSQLDHLERADDLRIARRVVSQLSPKCKSLWRMIFWDQMSYRQISEALRVQEVTVRERMSACRKEARKLAGKYI